MKVGIVYTSVYPPLKGPRASDRRVRDIARGISLADCEVTLFLPGSKNSGIKNVDFKDFKIEYISSFFKKFSIINRILFYFTLPFYCKNNGIKYVIFYTPSADCIISIYLLKFFGVKIVQEICDMISHNYKGTARGFYLNFGEGNLASKCDYLLPISKDISNFLKIKAPKTPSAILPILVDTDAFENDQCNLQNEIKTRKKYLIPSEAILIVYAGGMYHSYGVGILLDAYAELLKMTHKCVHLVIAGKVDDNPEYTDVLSILKCKHLEGVVSLTGWLETKDLIDLLKSSDILCIPHLDTEFNRAGLPTKLGEYSSLRKAIISTDVGDIKDYFTHLENIFLVKGSSVTDLIEGLHLLVEDDGIRKNLASEVKKVCDVHFDYKVNGVKLKRILENL